MNKADLWLGANAPNAQSGNTEERGIDTARLIAQRPSVIVVSRKLPGVIGSTQLDPQTVRIEVSQGVHQAGEQRNVMVNTIMQYVVVIGYRNCPGYPDTDLERADRFFYQNRMYEVYDIIDTVPGRLLVSCELKP
jgi:hypothetical protein